MTVDLPSPHPLDVLDPALAAAPSTAGDLCDDGCPFCQGPETD